jgi:hypothetical protein
LLFLDKNSQQLVKLPTKLFILKEIQVNEQIDTQCDTEDDTDDFLLSNKEKKVTGNERKKGQISTYSSMCDTLSVPNFHGAGNSSFDAFENSKPFSTKSRKTTRHTYDIKKICVNRSRKFMLLMYFIIVHLPLPSTFH